MKKELAVPFGGDGGLEYAQLLDDSEPWCKVELSRPRRGRASSEVRDPCY